MAPEEVLDMCDHAKLDKQLDTYPSARHFAKWIPDPAETETLLAALRQFAHELAQALENDTPEKQDAPPLSLAAATAGRYMCHSFFCFVDGILITFYLTKLCSTF